jgi:repressor LexA
MRPITDRQRQILAYIVGFRDRFGVTPTRAAIARTFSIAPTAAGEHVMALRRRGALKVDKATRAIVLPARLSAPATPTHAES